MNRRRFAYSIAVAAVALQMSGEGAGGEATDQFGPDPLRSERCIALTYGHSVMCTAGAPRPESEHEPYFIFSCGATVFMLISHRRVQDGSFVRKMTLTADHGEFTATWLAVAPSRSALHLIRGESDADAYAWMLRLAGVLATHGVGRFEYAIENTSAAGRFELDYSDRKLVEQIIWQCEPV